MAGMDRNTGKALSGWPHVVQSLGVLLTTARASRVMRRPFGSDLPRKVDAPISPANVVDFYAAAASAIDAHEPRFRVKRFSVEDATGGAIAMLAEGVYYPRGHLGDFSISEPQTASIAL